MLVCTRWRDIVKADPTLWNHIVFSEEEKRYNIVHQNYRHHLSETLVSSLLDRSKQQPLDVDICFYDTTSHPDYVHDEDILLLLIAECHRWRHAKLKRKTIRMSVDMTKAIFLVHGRLPLLQSLALSIEGLDNYMQSLQGPLQMFSDAPNLKSITLLDNLLDDFTLPWKQLQRIEILRSPSSLFFRRTETPDSDIYADTLMKASDLKHITLQCNLPFSPIEKQAVSVTSVAVSGFQSVEIAAFSHLTNLVVTGLECRRHDVLCTDTQSLAQFLRQVSTTLRHLTLVYGAYDRWLNSPGQLPDAPVPFIGSRLFELCTKLQDTLALGGTARYSV